MEVGEWEVNRAGGCHLVLAICGLRGGAMGNIRLMRRMKTCFVQDLHCPPPPRLIRLVTTLLKMLIGGV